MLTKLEVNGFKNLIDFSVSFGPFTCIAGLNGVGKSNIFDAIRFLALLADRSIVEAAMEVRGSKSADLLDIFWTNGVEVADRLSLAVEMIVPGEIMDDFGRSAMASSTFLRYEVELGRESVPAQTGATGLYLIREQLAHINKGDAPNRLSFPLSAKEFRNGVVSNKRRNAGFISTHEEEGMTVIRLHQDGGSSGNPQTIPARYLPKTVVANTNSNAWPTILAARREMQSWWFLSLEPTAMRRSNGFHENGPVGADGGGLAGALYRLYREDQNVLSRVASRLTAIIPTSDVRIDVDEVRRLLTVEVKERSGAFLPARSLSDGTLRFLALCIMAEDPKFGGLLCFEEPENGIHPAKMGAMLSLLKELAVDPYLPVSDDNPMRQIIVATHSPVLVGLENPDDLIYADIVKVKSARGKPTSTIRCKSLKESWRATGGSGGVLERASIIAYLSLPLESQISLALD
jgi:predicted ATPase